MTFKLKETKKELRDAALLKRSAIPSDIRREYSSKICSTIMSLASYRHSDIILAYYPMNSEVDIKPLILSALSSGKRIALPCCHRDEKCMHFSFISSLDGLCKGKYSIPEPPSDAPIYQTSDMHSSLMIIPALLYDKKGYRIGYGGGYYDRFIRDYHGATAGLVFSEFVVDSLPVGKFDISVDYIVTERGVKIVEKA